MDQVLQVRETIQVPKLNDGEPVTEQKYHGGVKIDVPVMVDGYEWHTVGAAVIQDHLVVVTLGEGGMWAWEHHGTQAHWSQLRADGTLTVQRSSVETSDGLRLTDAA